MLTDTALRNLKPKSLTYKVSDRDGMYVTVSPAGTVTFRYDYRLHGRRETLTIGRYGALGISLALAREKLLDAKKTVMAGRSPALEKQRESHQAAATDRVEVSLQRLSCAAVVPIPKQRRVASRGQKVRLAGRCPMTIFIGGMHGVGMR